MQKKVLVLAIIAILLSTAIAVYIPQAVAKITIATTTTTLLSSSGINQGDSVTDTATVTTGATGSVIFEVSTNGVTFIPYSTNPLSEGNPNTATSDPYKPLAPGGYYFQAVYVGDGNYEGSTSTNAEGLKVGIFVAPEYLFGGLAALGACFAALVVFKRKSLPKLSHN